MARNDMLELDAEFLAQTDYAILVAVDGIEAWLPKSEIEWPDNDPERGDEIKISVPEWLAEDRGIA